MQTRPAPLDGMNHDDGLDEFRVSAPRDIQSILKQLLDGSVLLSLHGEDGVVFTTALWTLDGTRGTVGFNADPADPAMAALLRGDDVTVVGYLDSVKIQFEVQGLRVVSGQRASASAISAEPSAGAARIKPRPCGPTGAPFQCRISRA